MVPMNQAMTNTTTKSLNRIGIILSMLLLFVMSSFVDLLCHGFYIPYVAIPRHQIRCSDGRCCIDNVRPITSKLSASSDEESSSTIPDDNNNDGRIDTSIDERLYRVRISRATGIEWGTDLSFAFVYVRELDPTGQAAMCGKIQKGDQLCELIPVTNDATSKAKPINLLGSSFDYVMTTFAQLDKSISEIDLVFFHGTKQEVKVLCQGEAAKADTDIITVTVIENKGSPGKEKLTRLQAPAGTNVRQLLVDNGINVYQSVTRWTNCKGKQLCGTCIVNIADGLTNTNWKSMDEASTLRSNPDSYRLSCVTFAHGDVTVETFPPINADQWTR